MRRFRFEFGDAFKKELFDYAESDAVLRLIHAPDKGPQECDLILRTGGIGIVEASHGRSAS
jgi:hypothetical protein